VLVLSLAGRVGIASAPALSTRITTAISQGYSRLVLDVARVDYASSAAIQVLEMAADQCRSAGGTLVLCTITEPVRIALDLANVLGQLPIEDTRERAIACAQARKD
jgi:stage II sporulation protein AA (anti-sigma F factor antagonist)